jgi:hypothetical protein
MKKLVRKVFRIKAKQVEKTAKNVRVGRKTLHYIKQWENQQNSLIIRSNFNRELYYKYLETIKS